MAEDRDRSASPMRNQEELPAVEPKPKKQKPSTGGFKWKEKRSRDDDDEVPQRDGGRLERGYRNRSPRRDSYREREPERHRDSGRGSDNYRPNKDRTRDHEEDDARIRDKFGDSYRPRQPRDSDQQRDVRKADSDRPSKAGKNKAQADGPPKPKKAKPAPMPTNEPMIVVNINDRLGTKAAIPCLASDSIKAFKAVVAAHIGRQPHEIMLKRQGERPFKDQLTLVDYGVSNGVQLDLELDTGD